MMQVSFHRCKGIRLDTTYVDNANQVTLDIESDEQEIKITLFDLPKEITDKLNVFRDERTHDWSDELAAEIRERQTNYQANAF